MAGDETPTSELAVPARAKSAESPAEPQTITIPVVLPLKQHVRMWMLLSGVLGIMLIAALVIIGYLWSVNGKWQAQVASLTETGYSLGDRIAEHQRQIEQLESTNELLADQLSTAKDRVLSLSNEKAQWSDETAYAQQQVDLLLARVEGAQSVVGQLGRCVEGEQQLVEYLTNPPTQVVDDVEVPVYTDEQIAEYRASVDKLCASAVSANQAFQESLSQ